MAALRQAARRLCSRLGTKTGLIEPTAAQEKAALQAAQEKAALQAAMEAFKFDAKDVDDVARNVFKELRKEGDQDLTLADVTHIVQVLSNLQNKDEATSNN